MAQEHMEEYLESIYDLEKMDGSAKTTAIAKCLDVAPASVTESLRSLSDKGLVRYEPYQGATLTESGRVIAEKIKRRHRLLEVFLTDVLKIKKEMVHDEACKMEHAISKETECALCKMLDAPSRCPHGSPIGPCDKEIANCAECRTGAERETQAVRERKIIPITDLRPNDRGKIAFIRGDCRIVQRLSDLGLTLGTTVSVMRKAPMNGPVEVFVRRTKLAVDHAIAENIFVDAVRTERS
jgi:DtxR family Mn-dependent transcriptional regulator